MMDSSKALCYHPLYDDHRLKLHCSRYS